MPGWRGCSSRRGWRRSRASFEQFDAVAKRIIDVNPLDARQVDVCAMGDVGLGQRRDHKGQRGYLKRGMCLAGGRKGVLDTQMQPDCAMFKPEPTPACKRLRV